MQVCTTQKSIPAYSRRPRRADGKLFRSGLELVGGSGHCEQRRIRDSDAS